MPELSRLVKIVFPLLLIIFVVACNKPTTIGNPALDKLVSEGQVSINQENEQLRQKYIIMTKDTLISANETFYRIFGVYPDKVYPLDDILAYVEYQGMILLFNHTNPNWFQLYSYPEIGILKDEDRERIWIYTLADFTKAIKYLKAKYGKK